MHQAPGVQEAQDRGRVSKACANLLPSHRRALREIPAFEQLHGVERPGLVHAVLEDTNDPGMVETREGLVLALEQLGVLGRACGVKALEREALPGRLIEHLIHGAHAACPERALDAIAVTGELLAGHGRGPLIALKSLSEASHRRQRVNRARV
jgi:hypothetical protein